MNNIDVNFYRFILSVEDEQKIRSTALLIATDGHKGVFRNDKKTPYIEHPKAVARIAVENFKNRWLENDYTSKDVIRMFSLWIEIVSYFHDLIEDVEKWINKERELIDHLEVESGVSISSHVKDYLIDALQRMNKHNFPTYLEFILASMENLLSYFAKEGDLTHNVSDLGKGSLREKYVLSLHIIQNKIIRETDMNSMDITGLI
jgi:(p)ppGpp synthase/HD superfamily hydrolase